MTEFKLDGLLYRTNADTSVIETRGGGVGRFARGRWSICTQPWPALVAAAKGAAQNGKT